MESINEVLSEKLQVKPLDEGEVKIFKLIRAGIKDPNTEDQDGHVLLATPAGHSLSSRISIRDPHKGRNILIGNIVGQDPVNEPGKPTYFNEVVEPPSFDSKGVIICTPENQGTYEYLMRHPKNRDNPFRSRKKAPVFYLIDEEADNRVEADKTEFMLDLLAYVSLMSAKELFTFAHSLNDSELFNFDLNKKASYLKTDIVKAVQRNPYEAAKLSDNEEMKWHFKINELLGVGAITFNDDPSERIWRIKRQVSEPGLKKLVAVEVGNDPIKGLIGFLMTAEGAEAREALDKKHEEFYAVES